MHQNIKINKWLSIQKNGAKPVWKIIDEKKVSPYNYERIGENCMYWHKEFDRKGKKGKDKGKRCN